MDGDEKDRPPDPGGTLEPSEGMQIDIDSNTGRKRVIATRKLPNSELENQESKKKIQDIENASASIAHTYKHPSLESGSRTYGNEDSGPFIVHVSRIDEASNSGVTLRPIKVGLIFVQNKISNIVKDGIKSLGRNRVSVQFKSAEDANNFMSNTFLIHHKLLASIPSYNVSRMGLVRGVPIEWSMEDFVDATDLREGPGRILKARRLQRKVMKEDSSPTWIPTQSVVLTFEGQNLPQKVYAFYTSLVVEIYQLPTIQCRKCLRFGHVQNQCRSEARCYRCSKKHPGDDCKVVPENASCIFCSGRHFATDRSCPEYTRQKSIKMVMSEHSISYSEASARFPAVRKSYADVAKAMFSPVMESPLHHTSTSRPFTPLPSTPSKTTSYRRTIFQSPRPRSPPPEGYDYRAHQNIVADVPSQLPNGCAFSGSSSKAGMFAPNENFFELIFKLLTTLVAKFSDILPNDVAPTLITLAQQLSTLDGSVSFPNTLSSVEQ